jgi:hypothetical protein
MVSAKSNFKVMFGEWYQRTTLHLTEVHKFLSTASSDLELSKEKLKSLRDALGIKTLQRKTDSLEYVEVETKFGINFRYYEDGLCVLGAEGSDIKRIKKALGNYFDERLKPSLNFLFSLGAPTPKILSDIEEDHIFVVSTNIIHRKDPQIIEMVKKNYNNFKNNGIEVFKSPQEILLIHRRNDLGLRDLMEMQIFFKDFKGQLQRYLNIHRKIWENIAEIKEKSEISGKEASDYRNIVDGYQKTISLIRNRINQMGTYAKTRQIISGNLKIEKELKELFQYRFEDLFDTLDYIKEIWNMTSEYVESSIDVLKEIKEKSSFDGLKSIQLLASIGVVTGVLRYMNPKYFPILSLTTAAYVIGLGIAALLLDYSIKKWQKNKKYKLKFIERSKKL